jgi:CRP/FNR family cyclic AMP-dependent transcriptional regulator
MTATRDDVVPILGRMPLFRGVAESDITAIAGRFDEATYLAGHVVVTEGKEGPDFFIILDGTASVRHGDATVATLRPGDFFGEVAALDDGPRTATVHADTRLRCLTLPNGSFREFLLDHPQVAINLLPEVIRRFRSVMTSGAPQDGKA